MLAGRCFCRVNDRMRPGSKKLDSDCRHFPYEQPCDRPERNRILWYHAKLTIDDKYTYEAAMMTSGKSSVPLAKFVDDQGHAYKRDRLSIRHLTIDITDTLGAKRHLSW